MRYAVVEHGGKQYRVSPGDELLLERVERNLGPGDKLELTRVLMLGGPDRVVMGAPTVADAKVVATVLKPERGKKIIVFKKKRRKGYKRKQGHRQNYYRVRIEEIVG